MPSRDQEGTPRTRSVWNRQVKNESANRQLASQPQHWPPSEATRVKTHCLGRALRPPNRFGQFDCISSVYSLFDYQTQLVSTINPELTMVTVEFTHYTQNAESTINPPISQHLCNQGSTDTWKTWALQLLIVKESRLATSHFIMSNSKRDSPTSPSSSESLLNAESYEETLLHPDTHYVVSPHRPYVRNPSEPEKKNTKYGMEIKSESIVETKPKTTRKKAIEKATDK